MSDANISVAAEPPGRRLRWGWIAWRVVPVAVVLLVVAAWNSVVPWVSQLPQPLGRHLTEWFLRALLVAYAATLATAVLGALLLPVYVLWGRRRGVRRPIAARLWLLSASTLIGLVGVELSSAVWQVWEHQLPVLPTTFSEPSKPGELTITVIGGSSALGFPYQPWLSVGQIVAWQLEKALPGHRVQTDIRAGLGVALETGHNALASMTRRPDIMIIYSGHNEFQARIEYARSIRFHEEPSSRLLSVPYQLSLKSPFCRLIYETVSKNRLGGPPSLKHDHHLIDAPAVTRSEYDAMVADFHLRLEAIVSYCERIGCIPVLIIPPANEGGFEPNRSILPATVTQAERDRLTRAFFAARAIEADQPSRALAAYRGLLDRHPDFAEIHFRIGRLLERAGDYDEANRHYIAARDNDAFLVRCQEPYMKAYRSVARRHSCILIDGPAVLRRIAPHGILDDHLFHDAHHPSLVGHVALSEAILKALRQRGALGWRDGPAPALDPAEVADHFGMDTAKWVAACTISSSMFRAYTLIRYDPTERQSKTQRLVEAAARIAQGVPLDAIGVPGFGVRPPPRS